MVDQRTSEPEVHRMLARRLAAHVTDESWSDSVEHLCRELLALNADRELLVAAVVRASAVVQQFLLDLFLPHPDDRVPALRMAAWLVETMDDDIVGARPDVRSELRLGAAAADGAC